MPRYLYIVEDDTGRRTAHELMRGAKLQATLIQSGKLFRGEVRGDLSGRALYASLYNHDGLIGIVQTHIIDRGHLREVLPSEK